MVFSLKTLLYQAFIDPILSGLHRSVLVHVEPSHRVIDIACGTGALVMAMAQKARHVTGIDLAEDSIIAAQRTARRRRADNIRFELRDAGNLSCYTENEFDLAVTSMAVHQFDADLAVKILAEMKRIARKVIIADYNHHMLRGFGRSMAWSIECIAGGDHYRNYKLYMQLGGLHYFVRQAGMVLISEEIRGGGVFAVAVCDGVSS